MTTTREPEERPDERRRPQTKVKSMIWSPSHDMLLASHNCTRCHGAGRISRRRGKVLSCSCVLRNIFRACLARFRQCSQAESDVRGVTLERTSGQLRRNFYGRRKEEYLADFYLIARRTLDESEFDVFKYHFLYGADWKLCCRRLEMDRGTFFHAVYRIQQALGRAFRDIEPYPLFPLDDYFNNAGRLNIEDLRMTIEANEEPQGPRPLVPPLRKKKAA